MVTNNSFVPFITKQNQKKKRSLNACIKCTLLNLFFHWSMAISPYELRPRTLEQFLWSTRCGTISGCQKGLPSQNKILKITFSAPSLKTLGVRLINKSEQRHSCTNWKAEAGLSCLAGEVMGSGRQRCSGSSCWHWHSTSPDCARSKQVGHRERAAWGEEKVEKGSKTGRKWREGEAIAVKWQWGMTAGKPSLVREKKKQEKSHKNFFWYKILLLLSAIKSIAGTSVSNKNNWVPNHPKSAVLYSMEPPTTHTLWPGICWNLLLLPCSCPWPSRDHPLPSFGMQVSHQSWIEL